MALQENSINLTLSSLYTILAIAALLLGIATTYLRLYLGNTLAKMKEEIIQGVRLEFVNKEVVSLQIGELKRRVQRLESHGQGRDESD